MSIELYPSSVALISLAANLAASRPKQGLCQIARHIRNEAGEKLDCSFDQALSGAATPVAEDEACCTPTGSGQSCC